MKDYIQQNGPFDGVLGFSQGGTLAMMLASWCEATNQPARREALSTQRVPLTLEPPQAPFKFAICVSGFRATPQYYEGFYNPPIQTPALHITADLDIMVSSLRSRELTSTLKCVQLASHPGGHYVPTGAAPCSIITKYVERHVLASAPSSWNYYNSESADDSDSSCGGLSTPSSTSSSRSSSRRATFRRIDSHQRRVLWVRS
jgi:hypothetical protein